jgi:hypothetical protein
MAPNIRLTQNRRFTQFPQFLPNAVADCVQSVDEKQIRFRRFEVTVSGRSPNKPEFFVEQKMRPNEVLKKPPISVNSLQVEAL